MITTQIEPLDACLEELKVLFPLHWQELAVFKDKMELAPQYHVYADRYNRGELVIPTARADGKIIGYWPTFIAPGLHYGTTLTATMDILYVDPAYRGEGVAKMLAETLKDELIRRGVKLWYVGSKLHKDIEAFYESLGFTPIEKYFGLWLGTD